MRLVSREEYDSDKQNFEKKMLKMLTKRYLILLRQLKKTDYHTKIKEIEDKIPSIDGLVATALNAKAGKIEVKISNHCY